MTRWMLAGGLLALAGLPAASPTGGDIGMAGHTAQPPLYGAAWDGSLGLVRVDPGTLRPLGGRRVPLDGEPLGWSFAPGRSRAVLAEAVVGARGGIVLIDARTGRPLRRLRRFAMTLLGADAPFH